jgi:hypothetical protein
LTHLGSIVGVQRCSSSFRFPTLFHHHNNNCTSHLTRYISTKLPHHYRIPFTMSDAREFNYGTETTNTANQGAAMSDEPDCLDRFDYESLPGPQSPVTSMNKYGSESDLEPALSPDLDELDVGHSMGGTKRSVNAGPAGGRHQQPRTGLGSCGTVFTGTYQLPPQNTPFMFGRPQSASNTASHNPNPSSLSGDPSPPTNPNLPVFRSRP